MSEQPLACGPGRGADICPTLDECHGALRDLLPRGRAWNAAQRAGTTLWRFWRALAHLFQFINARICAASEEFFCSTANETRDGWLYEYGLPDACDPFPDLCTKVAAIGGTRCDYYAAVAARAGWSVTCNEGSEACGAMAGCGKAGTAVAGRRPGPAQLRIIIHLDESPAYQAPTAPRSQAGCLKAGQRLSCGPNVAPAICLLERVVHAHLNVTYEVA
ncbi:hypothetical protein [Xanthobacter sp. 91]|uniref:hypothetical protein n=1 Tax=Xanthobacter sp. 91 TaxID=1117244 RepID=UPI0004971313|nr:hypothetical protein [Xanthobacter sp. 91]